MTDEIEVSVGDDVVTEAQATEPEKAEETKADAAEEATKEDASTEKAESDEVKVRKNRVQDRIDKLTQQKNEALREAEYWRNKVENSEGTKRELAEHEAEKASTKVESLNADAWSAKVDAARVDIPDYDEVVGSSKAEVKPHVASAVLDSDLGPQLFHHLAKNPEALEQLNGMSEKAALKEIGRLEAQLETPKQPATAFKKVSSAPEPVKPVGQSRGVVQKPLHEMNQAEYEEYRRKHGARW